MKSRFFLIALITLLVSAGLWAFTQPNQPELLEKRAELVMRQIGHKVLLYAGDSTSRVLPVKKINSNTFLITFQSQFTFVPDTLVKVVHESLASGHLPLQYTVNVLSCKADELIYGYEMKPDSNNTIACLGRSQPEGCYKIQISFAEISTLNKYMNPYSLMFFLSGIVIGVFLIGKKAKPKAQQTPLLTNGSYVGIGHFAFCIENRTLKSDTETIELSEKETKLLSIFATNPNQVIERERLLKEVWEDDGVFVVGRSLDVFVSKLRKKLQKDTSIKIVNIHGKGYKLEVEHQDMRHQS